MNNGNELYNDVRDSIPCGRCIDGIAEITVENDEFKFKEVLLNVPLVVYKCNKCGEGWETTQLSAINLITVKEAYAKITNRTFL